MSSLRILILGGTGFISSHVVKLLNKTSCEIILFNRGITKTQLPSSIFQVHGNRSNLLDFSDLFKTILPNIVLDMIPKTKQDARLLINAFEDQACRLVIVSSLDVYRAYGRLINTESGVLEKIPLSENAPLRQKYYPLRGLVKNAHNYDKILVEREIITNPTLPATILRLPIVYGPGDTQHRLFKYIKRMNDERPILLDNSLSQWRSTRGYVENIAAAIALAVTDERAAGQIYNVGESQALSEAEWVARIGQLVGWNGRIISVPKELLPPNLAEENNTAQNLVVDTSKIRQELGYKETVSQEEGLIRTIVWEKTHPPNRINPNLFDYTSEDDFLSDWKLSLN